MHRGPHDSRYTREPTDPSWQSIAACFALMAAGVLALWSVTYPLAGAAVFAGGLTLFVGARKAAPLARCLSDCGGFELDVAPDLRICVVRPSADAAC